jgi:hypothetical protein
MTISFSTAAMDATLILTLKLHKKEKKYWHISDAEAPQCKPSIHREELKEV